MKEHPIVFTCQGERLVAVVSEPDQGSEVAVVIIVGGPQYRIGSHRQFVQLARSLAQQGVAALRFDVRGMGDSGGVPHNLLMIEDDIGAAIDALQRCLPQVQRVVLWGLCGGASAALLYVRGRADPRVKGLVLVNPWIRSAQTLARTQLKHYYWQRLTQKAFWTKLLSGGVAWRALSDLMSNLRRAGVPRLAAPAGDGMPNASRVISADDLPLAMAGAWGGFKGPKLLILSGNDYTAKEFLETVALDAQWRANLALPSVTRCEVADADHTFSDTQARLQVEGVTLEWLHKHVRAPSGPRGG